MRSVFLIHWLWLLLFFATTWPTWGVERFPPPEFDASYTMPVTTAPAPRSSLMEYVDLAVLLGALSASAYLALVKRQRRGILVLTVFSVGYFGFYRHGCICSVGSTQDVVLSLFQNGYTVPLSVVGFFLLPLIFALFFGRSFCAGVCPLGAIQDLVLVRPLKLRPGLESILRLLPWVYLGLAVLFAATGSAFIICQYDPFVSFFRRTGSWTMLAFGAGFLLVGTVVGRVYCRFLCPYGALLSLVSRFSKWNVTLTPDDCLRCKICDVACPYGAILEPAESITPANNRSARNGLGLAVAFSLAFTVGGFWVGSRLGQPFSKMHPTVRLAEAVASESPSTPATDLASSTNSLAMASVEGNVVDTRRLSIQNFRQSGRPVEELLAEAVRLRQVFQKGGGWLGVFLGLVLSAHLLSLCWQSPRAIYEPDPAACLSCGRCYVYCPKEIVRRKRIPRHQAIPIKPLKSF